MLVADFNILLAVAALTILLSSAIRADPEQSDGKRTFGRPPERDKIPCEGIILS